MMLLKFTPEQVTSNWRVIAPAIAKSLPPIVAYSEGGMTAMLESLMKENAVCWGYYVDDQLVGVMVTIVSSDPIMGFRNLLVYSVAAIGEITEEVWVDGMATLREYAKGKRLDSVIAYTNRPRIIKIAVELLDALVDYSLIELEV